LANTQNSTIRMSQTIDLQRCKIRDIYIVGAQCTGKTTLINAVEKYFKNLSTVSSPCNNEFPSPRIIKEVARGVLRKHNFVAEDIVTSPIRALELQNLILKAQYREELEAGVNGDWIISDRSGADPIVYASKYVGNAAADEMMETAEWKCLKERMRNGLVVVCEAGADWLADDGVRLMPNDRDDWVGFHRFFCNRLEEWGIGYEVLGHQIIAHDDRLDFVLEKLKP
jgi:nicotinamide riboside kinase